MICVGSDKKDSCLNFFQGDVDLYEPLRSEYFKITHLRDSTGCDY